MDFICVTRQRLKSYLLERAATACLPVGNVTLYHRALSAPDKGWRAQFRHCFWFQRSSRQTAGGDFLWRIDISTYAAV